VKGRRERGKEGKRGRGKGEEGIRGKKKGRSSEAIGM
jgi:hypothetical protein